jgi:hypothetical protein
MTKRQAIDSLRDKLRERNADSNYSNQMLYRALMEQARWLIKREISAGRIYKNTFFFQLLKCQKVIEVPSVDPCCPVKTNCKIYRTECKIPDIWIDNDGPIIKGILSVDGSTDFWLTSPTTWMNKKLDPYQQKSKQRYSFYSDGYIWFPEHNPHFVNILGFWEDDVTKFDGCSPNEECVRFLDTKLMVPDWLEAEMMAKALQQLAGISKRLPEDEEINKNPTRKS